jgi:hypothetical protein
MKASSSAPVGLLMGFALVALAAPPSRAGSVLSGDIVQISAPSSDVQGSDPTSNDHAFIWSEQSALVLPMSISVDMNMIGMSNAINSYSPSPGTIAMGIRVDTYLIHSDPVGSGSQNYVASVTFDTPILGIIDTISGLASTDSILGNPGTTYPGVSTDRALESPDSLVWVSNNGLTINFTTSTFVDEARVIVAAAVPEPSTLVTCVTGAAALVAFGWVRRRRVRPSSDAA